MAAAIKAPLASAGPSPSWYHGPEVRYAWDSPFYEKSELKFYLTTHKQGWLWREDTGVPLFVSHRRLLDAAHLHPATVPWALDSGGFTEVRDFGCHRTTPAEYVRAVARYDREIGRLEWAAPQDWMCEPSIIHGGILDGQRVAGTGLSVIEHQRLTVANFTELQALWAMECDLGNASGDSPFMPVLQGWEARDYLRCADMYDAAGVRLEDYPLVGLGSVCRRNTPSELMEVLEGVIPRLTPWLALHGFGMKTQGLELAGHLMTTADSASWSYTARREGIVLDGHTHGHCGNCLTYAKQWRQGMLVKVSEKMSLAQAA